MFRNSAAGTTCGQFLRSVRKGEGAEGAQGGGAEEGPNKRECHAQGEAQGRSQDLHWGHPPQGALRERRARKQAKGDGGNPAVEKTREVDARPVGRWRIRQQSEGRTAEGGATGHRELGRAGPQGGQGGATPAKGMPARERTGREARSGDRALNNSEGADQRLGGGEGVCKRKANGRRERTKRASSSL